MARKKRIKVFNPDSSLTNSGTVPWGVTEEMIRKHLLDMYENRGVSLAEGLALIHDAASAAAQHAMNRIARGDL